MKEWVNINNQKLRELLEQRIEQFKAEITNIPKQEPVRYDLETWIQCLTWVLLKIGEK